MYVILETEDESNIDTVRLSDVGCTLIFDSEEEASDYADKFCIRPQIVELDI